MGALLADPRLYRMLVAPPVDLHFRQLMDQDGILIVNLDKGQFGSDSTHLLGALIVTTLALAAMTRSDSATGDRRPLFIYVDEFQDFTTLSIASMVSELRKYGIGLCLLISIWNSSSRKCERRYWETPERSLPFVSAPMTRAFSLQSLHPCSVSRT